VQILAQLDHPNILRVFEFYEDNHFFYLIRELCNGSNLDKFIKEIDASNNQLQLTAKQVATMLKYLLSAIQYSHSKKIMNRNISLKNIAFENDSQDSILKIKDWGVAK